MLAVLLLAIVVLWSVLPRVLDRPQCGYWHQDSWSSYRYRCLRSSDHRGPHQSALSRMRTRGTVIWSDPEA